MRTLLIISGVLFLLLAAGRTTAQVPEKIYGKNKVLKTNEYYLQQKDLWKKEIDRDPKNADAWFNYYRADRNAYIVGEEKNTVEAKGINRFERLKLTVSEMEKQVPDSYEFNYVKWLNGNGDPSLFPYLNKAHELAPEKTEPLISLGFYYEVTGDYALRDKYLQAYYHSGEFSPGLLNYSYNLLMGLDKNAIIFTEGDKDTEGSLLLQKGKGIRTDVQLYNLNMLMTKEYRERVFKELGLPVLETDPLKNDFEKYRAAIIEHCTKNKAGRPVYAAITVSDHYTNSIKGKLFLTGLAYRYSPEKIDPLPILKKNIEEIYAMDYLTVYFPKDISEGNMRQFNGNYVPSFFSLHEYYAQTGNPARSAYYKDLALKTATAAGRLHEYEALFNKK